jgi:hypothetical protein
MAKPIEINWYCTQEKSTDLLKLPHTPWSKLRWPESEYRRPSLDTLYKHFFRQEIPNREIHTAEVDVNACIECYFEIERRKLNQQST